MHPIVIIGTGLAGYTLARELRKLDADTPLTLVTADDGRVYSKPMLSNALTRGSTPDALATADAASMSSQLDASIVTDTRVTAIDTGVRQVHTQERTLDYSRLVLALGADPIRVPLEGDASGEVLSVNDLNDYTRFREAIDDAHRVAIMGAGLIGCEFANDLANAGITVEVIDPAPYPLARLMPQAAGQALEEALAGLGVRWHFGTAVKSVDGATRGYRLTLDDGGVVDADAVLSAIGLRPRTALAGAAGLTVERGIVTDRTLRTSAEDVYALGDCAQVGGLVLPYVMPIMHAARALASTLSGNVTEVTFPAMPVLVKTPAHPVVLAPPPGDADGTWEIQQDDGGVRALFVDAEGHALGLALTGTHVAEKPSLTQQLPPTLA